MAACAALLSLMNLLEKLQRHPRPPITLHTNQVQTLTQKIAFLQDFLEVYNSHYSKPEMERLRNHIADAAYAAEDVIETHIVNRIHARSHEKDIIASSRDISREVDGLRGPTAVASPIPDEENICSMDLHQVIQNMGFVEKEVLEIKDTLGVPDPQRFIATDVVASKYASTEHNIMVGFDDVLNEMLDKLTRQPDSGRQIIPISGMGGIGKTTLARNVYINPLTEYHFDIRAWTTISQEYNVREVLLGALLGEKNQGSRESMSGMSEAEIGEMLYKSLCGRRYLIVLDDMWSHNIWDRVKCFFPNECNGSRIIVTTRLTNVASYLTTNCRGLEMDFLDQDKSWCLFCKTVFEEEDGCPSELEVVGKEISRNCKGLPLSIVVIGGLLAKSERTYEYWEYIAQNLNSIVNLEENERCFKILHTSYDQLPAHLKACFLYMGIFSEDSEISVSRLIQMWVAESFLKLISGKGLEEIAEEYLMDLVGRNLIMVHENKFFGEEKVCNIHDLLRDLCIREARKEKFICEANQHNESLCTDRRIAIHQDISTNEFLDSLKGGSTTRSLICYSLDVLPLAELRLLRVFTRIDIIGKEDSRHYRLEDIFGLVNMRYLSIDYACLSLVFPSSISQLWNLQTLYVRGLYGVVAPPEIWKMPLIRHIESDTLMLPDPPSGHMDGQDDFVLHELHTLVGISNLKLGEEVIKRIPNVKKLKIKFDYPYEMPLYLNNLDCLCQLEDLSMEFQHFYPPKRAKLMQDLTFPHLLKKLALSKSTGLHWEDISTKIGSLPCLQMLLLYRNSFKGSEWKTVEGQFCSLKYLQIDCEDLKRWSTESTHFPCLECLHLVDLFDLEEIPLCIGDIPTLKSIRLEYCSDPAVLSAKGILDEQEELGNESLRVRVWLGILNDKSLASLATENFQIERYPAILSSSLSG